MTNKEVVDFKKFYVMEFFYKVREKLKNQFGQENYSLVDELISHLSTQDDITSGIEKVATEKGSGELSIFLFDIFDRIEDYPPTLVYDALPEVVEDFVSGLSLMIEEDETRTAIQNINTRFIKTSEKIAEKEELSPAEILEERGEESAEIREQVEQEQFNLEQFIELEFNDQIQNKMMQEFSDEEAAKFFYFSQIIRVDLNFETENHIPEHLQNILDIMKALFPWKIGKSYRADDVLNSLKDQLDNLIKSINQLHEEQPLIIQKSLEEGHIIIPEVKEKTEFIREEIPEKPTTIDHLLSEYFQSDVNEYIDQFKENVIEISQSPDDPHPVRELLAKFQSFKEICMIHGYVLLEQFCSDMLDVLSEGLKQKKRINIEAMQYLNELYDLLSDTEKIKDPREKTDEALKLQDLPKKFETSLFPDIVPTHVEESEEPEVGKETEGLVETQVEEIAYADQDQLSSIYGDILFITNATVKKHLDQDLDLESAQNIFTKLKSACQLLKKDNLIAYFTDLETYLSKIAYLDGERKIETAQEVYQIHNSFVDNFSSPSDVEECRNKLAALDLAPEQEIDQISIKENEELLKILAQLEKLNLANFKENLDKIFIQNDEQERERQYRHFIHLKRNLSLIEDKEFLLFAEFYAQLFDMENKIPLDTAMLDEISHTYRLLVDSLETPGKGVSAQELISVLGEVLEEKKEGEAAVKEVLQEDEAAATAEKRTEEAELKVEEEQETEEDLDEIFRQESSYALDKVESAIAALQDDLENREQYRVIERSIHSLKSSARLMGHNDIVELAAPLEELGEKLSSTRYETNPAALQVITEAIQDLRGAVAGEALDIAAIIKKISAVELVEITPDIQEEGLEQGEKAGYQQGLEEKPLFSTTTDEDEDLLEIFKEEASEFIKIIERANAVLKKDLSDRDSLNQLEHASHSLKSAAKMLGFSEIGQIGDTIEVIAEAINKGEISNDDEINQSIGKSIEIIKKLTAGKKVDSADVVQTIQALNLQSIKSAQAKGKGVEEFKPASDVPIALDNETELFLKEGWELLEKVNQDLVKLEKTPDDQDLMNNLCRNLHTLKGSAQIMQFEKIGTMAHSIEDLFEQYRKSDNVISENELDIVFRGVDEIQNLIESIRSGKGETSSNYTVLISELNKKLGRKEPARIEKVKEVKKEPPKAVSEKKAAVVQGESEQVIKISTKQLDDLVNMAAELVVNKTQLLNYLERLKKIGETIDADRIKLRSTDNLIESFLEKQKYEEKAPLSEEEKSLDSEASGAVNELETAAKDFKEVLTTLDKLASNFYSITQNFEQNISQISNLTKHLHDDILQVRMVPTEFLFNRFPRAVRDLAKKQKKKINLVIEGEDTEMDRAMIESLTDPVMHLIRNAIDHGIETPSVRKKKGKDENGTLLLKARRDKNQVIIEVQDDGCGIDPLTIKEAIVKKKLVSKNEAAKMSTSEILDHVFHPGFSTKDEASDISGRGIGLDVVATHLQNLKGDIRINSTPDQGTVFSIRVPLTLAISQAMLIQLADEILAVPLTYVEETAKFKEADIAEKDEKQYIQIREDLIPVVELSRFLKYGLKPKAQTGKSNTAIIIMDSGTKYALVVDKVLHREEIVIKSLGEQLSKIPFISSGTIFGDGSVALILDISAITKKVEMEYFAVSTGEEEIVVEEESPAEEQPEAGKGKAITRKQITDRLPSALIIDDSLSVRKFVSSVLERNNYSTVLASNGPEALEKLESEQFDIIITDLEMPKMHGFELIEEIRSQERYDDLPIVILTGRVGREHKEKGMKLGANAYIVKPFKENDLVKTLENFIQYSSD